MVRNPFFSIINILGLAIGLATCLTISLYVFDELSFDRFHEKADRIVRVVFRVSTVGGNINEASVMPPTSKALKAEFPEVEEATRLRVAGTPIITIEDKLFHEEEMAFIDPNFFEVFTFKFLQGGQQNPLIDPNTVVITQTTAAKYFEKENAIGKVITFKESGIAYKVTGVIEDIPSNSQFQFDLFASMAGFPDAESNSWLESAFFTYLVIPKGYDYKVLEAKLPQMVEKYIGPQLPQAFGMNYGEYIKKGNSIGLYLQPLTDIHLHSDFAYDLGSYGDIRHVYIFGAIAFFMLLIASINFMNLSTAGSSKRAKEIGVRKVIGSGKWMLRKQFLMESILVSFIALLFAVGFVFLTIPFFNHLSGKDLSFNFIEHLWLVPTLFLFAILVGLFAGIYPAFFLSSFKPIAMLKGKLASKNNSIGLRSALVVFQFFISIVLIFSITVIYRQLQFIQHKKLGYDKEQVLIIPTWSLGKNEESFKNTLLQDNRVVNVAKSSYIPAGPTFNNNYFVHPQDDPGLIIKAIRYDVDEQYIPTLGMEMKIGRNFSKEYSMDSVSAIINETAAETFGWKDDAIGKIFVNGDNKAFRIIGVVKDFHFKSLHESITPMVMALNVYSGTLIVKIKPNDSKALLQTMKSEFESYKADLPFTYSFLDERINHTYQSEQRTSTVLELFAGLTIFVACLGLLGLITFTTYQRTKEIGVRKVLGASVLGIVKLLSIDFVKLVLIAIIIASPIAWWVMNEWLQDFAYRINIEWWMFFLAGVTVLAIALLTIGFQVVKAAVTNPVNSLRDE